MKRALVRAGYGFWWICTGDQPRNMPIAPDHDAYPQRTVWLDPVKVESSAPRIIENFLDLAHFPFVHTGYLGQEPYTEVARYGIETTDDELRLTDCVFWQPNPGPAAAGGGPVRYRYSVSHPCAATLTKVPSTGEDDLAGGFTILIVASPVTETECVVWRSTVVHDTGADLDAQQAFNDLIFSQDIDVVESQRPRRLPVDPRMESHQPADAGSLAYRKWLGARGIRYGTISTERGMRGS
ncbi:MAG: aromatic ring-hydroxylating dioxygenase subunit alpha [Acidimicrobiaceae bacterium]|nr:aromatic ring-hydroxylating dioxygenase subunit alpha [Acidimicrobiaceae bacterium]